MTYCAVGVLVACAPSTVPVEVKVSEPITEAPVKIMGWGDLLSRKKPVPTHEISIGEGTSDKIDLWVPDGNGPFSVVLMVHGGCWQKEIADRTLMNYAAEDLRQRGLAVWNIEYRGVDEVGGGYPGTFLDTAAAADAIRNYADEYNLDTEKLAAFGHSAGGHLSVWLAARHKLLKTSPLYQQDPLKIPAVVNSGGLADLEYSVPHTLKSCLADVQEKLTGTASADRPNVYSDTSPVELLPIGAIVTSVNGAEDGIAPSLLGEGITKKLIAAGDTANFIKIENSGHVELIAPGTDAFEIQAQILEKLLK